MQYEVCVAGQVEKQIEEVADYISSKSSPETAKRWTCAVRERMSRLKSFPFKHGLAPEAFDLGIQLRQIVFGSYRVLYTVTDKTVNVIMLRHSARQPIELDDLS
jgi:plasmid stabilization system protein ParE